MTVKMKFNGYDFSKKFKAFCDSRELPEFRDTATVVSGADGEYFDDMTIGVREFQITLIALDKREESLQTLARELMNILAVSKPKAFTFSDEKDKNGKQLKRYAVPTGKPDVQEFLRVGKWTIRFRQHDPYLYGDSSRSVVLKANQAKTIEVGGNAPALPVAKAKPGNSASKYKLECGSKNITYKANFTGSSTLTLDWEKLTAKASPALSGDGLEVGSRFFTFDGKLTLKASSKTTITWTERWL